MESKEPGLFSPSVKKSYSIRTPRKSTTPSRRRYLRQSFPTIESPTESPTIYSTNSFQQKLQDATDQQHQQQDLDKDAQPQNKERYNNMTDDHPFTSTSATLSISTPTNQITQKTPTKVRDISNREQSVPSRSGAGSTPKPAIARPPLRTTETEYDVSPARSARLSTPSRSLYAGTPSRPIFNAWDLDENQESDVPESPSSRHFRTRNARMNRGLPTPIQGQDLLERFSRTGNQDLSPRYTNRDDFDSSEIEDSETFRESIQKNGGSIGDGYNYGDDEVSFKRSEPASLSIQSTLIDHGLKSSQQSLNSWDKTLSGNGGDENDVEEVDDRDESGSVSKYPRAKLQYLESITPRQKSSLELDSEDSLIEMAEKTTAIAEELRGVYSTLQELFSPETEAKLNGAVSILSSQRSSSKSDKDVSTKNNISNDRRGITASAPKPPVFDRSQERFQRESSPPISKRKPAPLRPAIIKKSTRALSPELRQLPNQGRHEYRKNHHDVTLRGLISDAESARRLKQANKEKRLKRSQELPRESKPIVPKQFDSKETALDTSANGESHQDIFQKKLDRWRRVERQNQSSLPTYLDLYIPTTSSKVILQTDTEDYEDDYDDEHDIDDFVDLTPGEQLSGSLPSQRQTRSRHQPIQDLRSPTIRNHANSERKSRREENEDDYEANLIDRRSKRRREDEFWLT